MPWPLIAVRFWVGIGQRSFHWQSNHLLASLDFWELHITQDHGPGRYLNYFPLQWPFSFFGNKHLLFLELEMIESYSLMHGDGADVAREKEGC